MTSARAADEDGCQSTVRTIHLDRYVYTLSVTRRIVHRYGGSLAVTIPAEVARELSIHEGDAVNISAEADGFTVRPARSVAELLAGWEDLAPDVTAAQLARMIREDRDGR